MTTHILGICGTFMAGIAAIAKEAGFSVEGSDEHVYPPMSDQLRALGITLHEGYDAKNLKSAHEVIIGNAMSRGNASVEYILNNQLPYTSGPQWLYEKVLKDKWVIAVAGTHGKTTTTSMVAWILDYAGLKPGFLIGGIPKNFDISARLGGGKYFVIEADEYDSAFFDKRSKFIHYHPKTLIMNNLEYDHADIFPDIDAIKTQFNHLVRTVPGNGEIILPKEETHLQAVLKKGCWSPVTYIGTDDSTWQAKEEGSEGNSFRVLCDGKSVGVVTWSLMGKHNIHNALAAIAAAHHAGVKPEIAIKALCEFTGVKRRMEVRGVVKGVTIYDDFAHHPTAVATTLAGLRKRVGHARIIAVMEFGSYTMKAGVHRDTIIPSLQEADTILLAKPQEDWGLEKNIAQSKKPLEICKDVNDIVEKLKKTVKSGDNILVMSNKGFGGIYEKLLSEL